MLSFSVPVENIAAALIVAPKSDIRYYLNGVCFDVKAERIVTVATDGHRLLIARGGEVTVPDADEKRHEFTIPRDALEDVTRKVKGGTVIYVQVDGEKIKLTSTARTIESALVDARFPDWRRIMPKKTDGVPAQYSPLYIADFQRVSKLFCRDGMIHVGYNGLSPAVVTFPGTTSVVGVLMPYRIDENEAALEMLREVA